MPKQCHSRFGSGHNQIHHISQMVPPIVQQMPNKMESVVVVEEEIQIFLGHVPI